MQRVVQNSLQNNRHLLNDQTPKKKEELLNLLEAKIESYILQFETEQNYCEEFIDYSYADFNSSKSSLVDQLINQIFTENGYSVSELLGIKIKQLIYVYLRTKESNTDFTGLIFTGFGENEIYPSLIQHWLQNQTFSNIGKTNSFWPMKFMRTCHYKINR